jgi:hypothetical protein
VNSAALNEAMSRAHFILFATAASLGMMPQVYAELPGTNQISPHPTTQTLEILPQ